MVELDLEDHELDEQLNNLLSVARGLLKTAACYLSMPGTMLIISDLSVT